MASAATHWKPVIGTLFRAGMSSLRSPAVHAGIREGLAGAGLRMRAAYSAGRGFGTAMKHPFLSAGAGYLGYQGIKKARSGWAAWRAKRRGIQGV